MELTLLDRIGTYWHSVGDSGASSGFRLFTASANRSHSRGLASLAPIVAQYLAISGFRSIELSYCPVLLVLGMLWFKCGIYLNACQGGLVYELSVTTQVFICGNFRTLTATAHLTTKPRILLVLAMVTCHSLNILSWQSVLAVLPGKHDYKLSTYSWLLSFNAYWPLLEGYVIIYSRIVPGWLLDWNFFIDSILDLKLSNTLALSMNTESRLSC